MSNFSEILSQNEAARKAAAMLGRLGKGIPKKLTQAERMRRAEAMQLVGLANRGRRKDKGV